ncbi:MAG: CopG family transcriptional regulator [Thermoprotei archaeon]|nr:MAG: CopG family transcriptional regulator [Thermoprotei archaeon]
MSKVRRISITLPEEVLRDLDEVMEKLGAQNRSKVISNAIISYISATRWMLGEGLVSGSITLVYDHERGETVRKITHIQHEFVDVIKATIHVHLSEKLCLEIISIVGNVERLKKLLTELREVKAVLGVSFSLFPIAEE